MNNIIDCNCKKQYNTMNVNSDKLNYNSLWQQKTETGQKRTACTDCSKMS